ncbi:uncharacterized protein LOC129918103 [Episyrphus balteatus]|uniref:uncharacterized protein LOC129918103 n=1 Tax=Episyrphus balteatus TaxID=286459 RepID=UPI002486A8B6|nr:uncharacterized protein LOC129918103 [Episyrphus balteatus]
MNFPTTSCVLLAVFSAEFLTTQAEFYSKFLDFIENIKNLEKFDSILFLKSSEETYFDEKLIEEVGIPVILATENSSFYLKQNFNENLLTIIQFDEESAAAEELLQRLSEILQHLRFCKTIFMLKSFLRNDVVLKRLFNFCWQNRMINVVAVFQNFGTSSIFYSYSNFGMFKIEEFTWSKEDSVDVFPDRMRDLHRITLPILFGGSEPGVILSGNVNSSKIAGGLIWHFFHAFAKRHNAKLNRSSVSTTLSSNQMHRLVFNETIEIAGASMIVVQYPIEWYSYPYQMYDVSVILPLEPSIPIYKVFAYVFHGEAFGLLLVVLISLSISLATAAKFTGSSRKLRDFLFNIDPFRGMLGQSITEEPTARLSLKILYSLIFMLGIIMVTSYDAFLQSFMTEPPKEKFIETFEDLQHSGLKILAYKADLDTLMYKIRPDFMKIYSNLFQVETDFEILTKTRDSLNTKYAFTSSTAKWNVYDNQQKFFGQQLFRWSETMLLLEKKLSSISMNENSIYMKTLNNHILATQASGLLDFWTKRGFFELMQVGKIEKLAIKSKSTSEPLKVGDLRWIFTALGFALVFDSFCFIGEIFIFKWKRSTVVI